LQGLAQAFQIRQRISREVSRIKGEVDRQGNGRQTRLQPSGGNPPGAHLRFQGRYDFLWRHLVSARHIGAILHRFGLCGSRDTQSQRPRQGKPQKLMAHHNAFSPLQNGLVWSGLCLSIATS
jgi:hypothetical protein